MIFKISFQKHCIFLMGPTILWFFRCGEHNLKNLPNSLKKKKKKKKKKKTKLDILLLTPKLKSNYIFNWELVPSPRSKQGR